MSDDALREQLQEVYSTREQQRCLLHHLFTNVLAAQRYMHRAKDELFDSQERRWLLRTARRVFHESCSLMTENVLKGELDLVFNFVETDESKKKRKAVVSTTMNHNSIMTEWNLVVNSSVNDTPEWIVEDLEKKFRASNAISSIQRCVDNMKAGQSDEAIKELCGEIIALRSQSHSVKPVRRFSDMEWRVELVKMKQAHPELYAGVKTNFDTFDKKTGGMFRGELFLVSAHTGVGKSTFMRSIIHGLINNKANVLLIVNEEVEEQVNNKFDAIVTNIPYLQFKRASLTVKDIEKWREDLQLFSERTGELYIQEVPQFTTAGEIEATLTDLQQQGKRIDVVVLDYLDHLKPLQRSWSETDEQNKAVAEFKDLCIRFRVAGMTATQSDTQSFEKESINNYNVRGSKQKSGAANLVMFVKQTSDDDDGADWKINITKNRDGPTFYFSARFHKSSGLVKEISGGAARDTTRSSAGTNVLDKKKKTPVTTSNDEEKKSPQRKAAVMMPTALDFKQAVNGLVELPNEEKKQ